MNELIGLRFKRNVYGLSKWTKTIKATHIVWHMQKVEGIFTMTPEIVVEPQEPSACKVYSLTEIVII